MDSILVDYNVKHIYIYIYICTSKMDNCEEKYDIPDQVIIVSFRNEIVWSLKWIEYRRIVNDVPVNIKPLPRKTKISRYYLMIRNNLIELI